MTARSRPRSWCMSIAMLHIQVRAACRVHADVAYPFLFCMSGPSCISKSMLYIHVHRTACPYSGCIYMSIMSMMHDYYLSRSMLHVSLWVGCRPGRHSRGADTGCGYSVTEIISLKELWLPTSALCKISIFWQGDLLLVRVSTEVNFCNAAELGILFGISF
jgi:hypothetical protein